MIKITPFVLGVDLAVEQHREFRSSFESIHRYAKIKSEITLI